jgi:hypothetical protein
MTTNPTAARQPLFRPGGDLYAALPLDLFYGLDADLKASALEVMGVLVDKHRAGDLDEMLTDNDIAELIHRSVSFVQKGLHTLHNGVADVLDAIIIRTRARGRRTIQFVRGLRGSQRDKPDSPPAPPLPLPEEEQKDKTTTAGSSSSLIDPPDRTDGAGPDPTVVRALFERARQLVDGVSLGAVAEAAVVFTAESVRRALDWMEKRNRKPGTVRKDWGYVLGILRNKQQTGWPEDPPAAKPQATRSKATTIEETAAEKAREDRLRGLWAALSEGQREEIRAAVKAENPGLDRWPNLMEPLYLAELERRQPAEEARSP